ncbi:MAG TPA: type II secretion system F family protein [Verrucomicrobiota bacterium]|nr:type II secretion system F family protein [Verrucomicrobiota bacterium]
MNTEELAFVNRQLAGMLKSGIPLEAGLKKMTKSMSDSRLKDQLGRLGSRLEKGQAVGQAVEGLDLPDTYKRLLVLGQESQSMPKVLSCVADYYERIGTLVTRIRGLAIYPMLILVCGLLVAALMAFLSSMLKNDIADLTDVLPARSAASEFFGSSWISIFPIGVFAVGFLFYLAVLRSHKMRRYFSWKIPMLRDAALAQYAGLSEALLASGARLPEVIGMVRKLESGSPMETDLAKIEQNLVEGHAGYDSASRGCRTIPDFFNWIVAQAGEDVTAGFGHARSIYTSRAESKMQAFLCCFLPVNILLIGLLLLVFFLPQLTVATDLLQMIEMLGGAE